MAQGPLPIEWVTVQTGSRGLWGEALRAMRWRSTTTRSALKMVGEMLPRRAQPGDTGRRARPVWPAGRPDHLQLGRQRQGADPARAWPDADEPRGGRRARTSSARRTTPTTSPARRGWASMRRPAWWTPIAGPGISRTCGCATVRCFPTTGGVNPSLTITAIAMRTAERIGALAARGEL